MKRNASDSRGVVDRELVHIELGGLLDATPWRDALRSSFSFFLADTCGVLMGKARKTTSKIKSQRFFFSHALRGVLSGKAINQQKNVAWESDGNCVAYLRWRWKMLWFIPFWDDWRTYGDVVIKPEMLRCTCLEKRGNPNVADPEHLENQMHPGHAPEPEHLKASRQGVAPRRRVKAFPHAEVGKSKPLWVRHSWVPGSM